MTHKRMRNNFHMLLYCNCPQERDKAPLSAVDWPSPTETLVVVFFF